MAVGGRDVFFRGCCSAGLWLIPSRRALRVLVSGWWWWCVGLCGATRDPLEYRDTPLGSNLCGSVWHSLFDDPAVVITQREMRPREGYLQGPSPTDQGAWILRPLWGFIYLLGLRITLMSAVLQLFFTFTFVSKTCLAAKFVCPHQACRASSSRIRFLGRPGPEWSSFDPHPDPTPIPRFQPVSTTLVLRDR